MKFYFNRTGARIFDKEEAKEEFYDAFFKRYDIVPVNENYLHFCGELNRELDVFNVRTIFFSKGRVIIFDAQLDKTYKVPYGSYSVTIHTQNEIKTISFLCDGDYDFPSHKVKVDMGSSVIEFELKRDNNNAKDCAEAISFLSKLMKTEE